MEPNSPVCLFFMTTNTKHHITLSPKSRNLTFNTQVYNSISLLESRPAKEVTAAKSLSYSNEEPFFVKVTSYSNETKVIQVNLVSINFPILYSNCKAEEVVNFFNLSPDGKRFQPKEVQSQNCINVIDQLQLFSITCGLLIGVFIVCIIVLHIFGCIRIGLICNCSRNYDGRLSHSSNLISSELKNPMDIVAPQDTEPLTK